MTEARTSLGRSVQIQLTRLEISSQKLLINYKRKIQQLSSIEAWQTLLTGCAELSPPVTRRWLTCLCTEGPHATPVVFWAELCHVEDSTSEEPKRGRCYKRLPGVLQNGEVHEGPRPGLSQVRGD